ncbi:MAG: GNAT family N-acetyltransferase [Candidatus Woesearchaeota archaeon]
MILIGEGFSVRNWIPGDEKELAKQGNNPKIARNLIDTFPSPYTLSDAKKWIKLHKDSKKNNFAIIINKKVAGCVGFSFKDGDKAHTAVMGYWLGEEYWGKGYATKVAKLIVNYIFDNFKIERIEAKVYIWNPPSAKVLEKTGFKLEGTARMSTLKAGVIVDEWIYSILRSDLN